MATRAASSLIAQKLAFISKHSLYGTRVPLRGPTRRLSLVARDHRKWNSTGPSTGRLFTVPQTEGFQRQTRNTSHDRIGILLLLIGLGAFGTAFLFPPYRTTAFDAWVPISEYPTLDQYIRRLNYYTQKGDHLEVYDAASKALLECERLGLRSDEPFVIGLTEDCALAMMRLGLSKEVLLIMETALNACAVSLDYLASKEIDAEELNRDYLHRGSKIPPDMTMAEYEGYQWGRKSVFKSLVSLTKLKAEALSTEGDHDEAVEVLINLIVQIEEEMGQDYSRAPDFQHPDAALSKAEIFTIIDDFRAFLLSRDIERAIPFSQRTLAIAQAYDPDNSACATVDEMRWMAVNLSGAGVVVELREGSRTPKAVRLYDEAKQWSELALDRIVSIKAAGGSGRHHLVDLGNEEDIFPCDIARVALLYLLAGMALYVDNDQEAGRRLLEEGLELAKAIGTEGQIENAEDFLKDMEAGTIVGENLKRDGALFGYTQQLARGKLEAVSGQDDSTSE